MNSLLIYTTIKRRSVIRCNYTSQSLTIISESLAYVLHIFYFNFNNLQRQNECERIYYISTENKSYWIANSTRNAEIHETQWLKWLKTFISCEHKSQKKISWACFRCWLEIEESVNKERDRYAHWRVYVTSAASACCWQVSAWMLRSHKYSYLRKCSPLYLRVQQEQKYRERITLQNSWHSNVYRCVETSNKRRYIFGILAAKICKENSHHYIKICCSAYSVYCLLN